MSRISIRHIRAACNIMFGNRHYLLYLFIPGLIVCVQILFSATSHAEPYIPEDDAVVLQKLPVSDNASVQTLSRLRNALSESSNDLTLAVELAREYLQMGRTLADPRYEGYAQAVLKPSWNMDQPPPEVLVLRAILRQRQHDFILALSDLDRALQAQPANVQAWLTQAAIHQVRGNYQAAYQSCMPLLRISSHMLATTCIAGASSLNGRAQQSYQTLQKTIEQAPAAAPQEKLWAMTILAEMAVRLEKYDEAEHYFWAALAVDRKDNYLLGVCPRIVIVARGNHFESDFLII